MSGYSIQPLTILLFWVEWDVPPNEVKTETLGGSGVNKYSTSRNGLHASSQQVLAIVDIAQPGTTLGCNGSHVDPKRPTKA